MISVTTSKRQVPVTVPIHPLLAEAPKMAPTSDSVQLAVNSRGLPWTESGFNSTFMKFVDRLEAEGLAQSGLTMHGLRHTLGTRLREVTNDLDLIRRILGQQTLSMAQHYSESADTSKQARKAMRKIDFTRNKRVNSCQHSLSKLSTRVLGMPTGGIERPTLQFSVAKCRNHFNGLALRNLSTPLLEANGLMPICQQFRAKQYGGTFRINRRPDDENAKMEASGQQRKFSLFTQQPSNDVPSGSEPRTTPYVRLEDRDAPPALPLPLASSMTISIRRRSSSVSTMNSLASAETTSPWAPAVTQKLTSRRNQIQRDRPLRRTASAEPEGSPSDAQPSCLTPAPTDASIG
jgi:hypothetical protein